MAGKSVAAVKFYVFYCFLLCLSTRGLVRVAAQQGPGIVIAHPGQDVELLCTVTENSGSQTTGWLVNNRPYTINALRSGILTGHSATLGSSNLIVENIMMNDVRNGSEYRCVIIMIGTGTIQEESDPTILYVAVTTNKTSTVTTISSTPTFATTSTVASAAIPATTFAVASTATSAMTFIFASTLTFATISTVASTPISATISTVVSTLTSATTSTVASTPTSATTSTVASSPASITTSTVASTPTSAMTSTVASTLTSATISTVASTLTSVTISSTPTSATTSTVASTPTSATTSTVASTPTSATTSTVASAPTSTTTSTVASTPPSAMTSTVASTLTSATISTVASTPTSATTSTVASTPTSAKTTSTVASTATSTALVAPTTTLTVTFAVDVTTIPTTASAELSTKSSTMVPIATHTTTDDINDDDDADNLLLIVIVVCILVVIICCCCCMDILFCYFRKRKGRYYQSEDKDKNYEIIMAVFIIVPGIFTCGTSILLWWLYKELCSSKDMYDVEDKQSVVCLCLPRNKSSMREDDKISPPVSNELTKFDESETIKVPYQNLDIEEPYAVSAKSLSKDLFTESSINCAYEIVERKKPNVSAVKGQKSSQDVSNNENINEKKTEEKTDAAQHQQSMQYAEYAIVDTSKKKKRKKDEQQKENMDDQPGEEIKEQSTVSHQQQTELHYMEPGNLEFKKGPDPQRLESDHTVQYGELADTQKYTSIL